MASPATGPRMLKGDEADVYRQHATPLMYVLRDRVRTPDDSLLEDASAFAWLQFLRRQPDRDTAFNWLCTVAIHEAWRLTRQRRQTTRLVDDTAAGTDPVDTDLKLQARDALTQVAQLPDRQRRYLTLHLSGYTYADISTHTGATHTNISKHLTRARRTIRARRPT